MKPVPATRAGRWNGSVGPTVLHPILMLGVTGLLVKPIRVSLLLDQAVKTVRRTGYHPIDGTTRELGLSVKPTGKACGPQGEDGMLLDKVTGDREWLTPHIDETTGTLVHR